jgi:hypothetical protein
MGLRDFFQEHTTRQTTELIQDLPLPGALRDLLLTNNTPDIYELLSVQTVEEYIGGFIANMAINIMSMVLVFILVWLLLRIVGNILNIIGRLPVINTLNRLGGLGVGFVLGMLVVWLGLTIVGVLFATPANPQVNEWLDGSMIARWLYENNWFLGFVTQT